MWGKQVKSGGSAIVSFPGNCLPQTPEKNFFRLDADVLLHQVVQLNMAMAMVENMNMIAIVSFLGNCLPATLPTTLTVSLKSSQMPTTAKKNGL